MARIKGAAVQDFFRWYATAFGDAHNDGVWARLPESDRAALGASHEQLLAFHWYPASSVHALIDLMLEGLPDAERDRVAREGARAIISKTLRGLYGTIFSAFVTPRRYLKSVNVVWKAFHDTGRIVGEELDPRHHRTELSGWTGYHAFIERLNGYAAKEIYEALGCTSVEVDQSRGGGPGAVTYVTEIRFQR